MYYYFGTLLFQSSVDGARKASKSASLSNPWTLGVPSQVEWAGTSCSWPCIVCGAGCTPALADAGLYGPVGPMPLALLLLPLPMGKVTPERGGTLRKGCDLLLCPMADLVLVVSTSCCWAGGSSPSGTLSLGLNCMPDPLDLGRFLKGWDLLF